MRLHQDKPDIELIDRLRQLGAQWFKNDDLLALEELIWRYQHALPRPTNFNRPAEDHPDGR